MQQEVVLAMLAKEPSQGYQLRARMNDALGPLGEALNAGQIYVTLGRLEKAGLVAVEETPETADPSDKDRKVYVLTAAGQQRVAEWLAEVSWPKPDLAEFHLKLIAAAAAGLADPIGIVDAQRRELLRRLRDVMAGSGTAQERLDRIVRIVAAELVAEVCSTYVMRAGEVLELFATEGLRPEAVHRTRLRVGEGLVGVIAATARPLALADAQAHPVAAQGPHPRRGGRAVPYGRVRRHGALDLGRERACAGRSATR